MLKYSNRSFCTLIKPCISARCSAECLFHGCELNQQQMYGLNRLLSMKEETQFRATPVRILRSAPCMSGTFPKSNNQQTRSLVIHIANGTLFKSSIFLSTLHICLI